MDTLNQSISLYLVTDWHLSHYEASWTKLRTERERFWVTPSWLWWSSMTQLDEILMIFHPTFHPTKNSSLSTSMDTPESINQSRW